MIDTPNLSRFRRLAAIVLATGAVTALPAGARAASGDLWTYGTAGNGDTGHEMYPGTSPSIADLSGGGYETAYATPGTALAVAGGAATRVYSLGMMAGSSPAIARQPGNGWEAAFEANTAGLWTLGTSGEKNWRLGMLTGTSPAIAELPNGGYQAAFEANTDVLWTAGSDGVSNTGAAMWPGTAPAVTGVGTSGSTYQAIIEGANTNLAVFNAPKLTDARLGMLKGTSPADATLSTGGTEVAFQANTGVLWTYGSGGEADTGKAMAAATNPAIAGLVHGGYEIAYQAANGDLAVYGSAGTLDTGLSMYPGASPSIAGLAGGGYEVAFHATPPPGPPLAPVVTQPTPTPVPVPAPTPPAPPGHTAIPALRVKIVLSWSWNHRHTRLRQLTMSRMPRTARVRLLCRGRGCPRRPISARAPHLRRFERTVAGTRFRSGDRVFLRITALGYRSERVFALIRNGALPKVRLL